MANPDRPSNFRRWIHAMFGRAASPVRDDTKGAFRQGSGDQSTTTYRFSRKVERILKKEGWSRSREISIDEAAWVRNIGEDWFPAAAKFARNLGELEISDKLFLAGEYEPLKDHEADAKDQLKKILDVPVWEAGFSRCIANGGVLFLDARGRMFVANCQMVVFSVRASRKPWKHSC